MAQLQIPAEFGINEEDFFKYVSDVKRPLKIVIEGGSLNPRPVQKPDNFKPVQPDDCEFKIFTTESSSSLTKTDVDNKKYIVKKYNDKSGLENMGYNIKEMGYVFKKRAYKFSDNEEIESFLEYVGSFDDKNILIVEGDTKCLSLEESLAAAEGALYWLRVSHGSNPLILQHDGTNVERERLGINDDRGKQRLNQILRIEKYNRVEFEKKTDFLLSSLVKKEEIGNIVTYFAESLLNSKFNTVVQEKCRPCTNTEKELYPVKWLGWGSRGIDLGNLFGYPSIYNKLDFSSEDPIRALVNNYCRKRDAFYEELLVTDYMKFTKEDQEMLIDDIYKQAVMSNKEEANELKKIKESQDIDEETRKIIGHEIDVLDNTSKNQMIILSQRKNVMEAVHLQEALVI